MRSDFAALVGNRLLLRRRWIGNSAYYGKILGPLPDLLDVPRKMQFQGADAGSRSSADSDAPRISNARQGQGCSAVQWFSGRPGRPGRLHVVCALDAPEEPIRAEGGRSPELERGTNAEGRASAVLFHAFRLFTVEAFLFVHRCSKFQGCPRQNTRTLHSDCVWAFPKGLSGPSSAPRLG